MDQIKGADVAKRDSTRKPKPATAPVAATASKRGRKATNETMADSVAIFIGKSVGTAIKRTRGLRDGVSKVGTEVVVAGSRAGQAIKEYLPEALGGEPATRRRKSATGRKARKTKTVAPKPAHGEDPLTHRASGASTKPAKRVSRGVAGQKRLA